MRNLLTIITPVYNGEKYLEEVIESVLHQEVEDLKHIIVDDGSTDGSLSIAQKYAQKFREKIEVVTQTNSGESNAVNTGFGLANSRFLMVVNADDPLLPGHCVKLLEVLKNNPHIVAAYPDWRMIDALGKTVRDIRTIEFSQRALIADLVCIPGPGTMFVRQTSQELSLRDVRFRYVSDYVFWLKLSSSGDFMRVPEVLATWRQHELGATATGGIGMTDELLDVASSYLDELTQRTNSVEWKKAALSKAYYYAAVDSLSGERKDGLHLLMKSLRLKPWRSFGYQTHHRSVRVATAILLGPFGRYLVKKLR